MHGWAPFKHTNPTKISVISVCPSHEFLLLGSLGPRPVSSSHIYTAPTDSELKLPKVLVCTSVKAFLQPCWSMVSQQKGDYLLNYIYFLSKDIYIFFKRPCACSVFLFADGAKKLKKHQNLWQMVPRNAEMYFFTLHLFNVFLPSPTSPCSLKAPGALVPMVITEVFRVPATAGDSSIIVVQLDMLPCLSQLVCVGGFSVACLRTDVILHVLSEKCGKSLWSPMKETYILQALLGCSDDWWWADTCNSESLLVPGQLAELAHNRQLKPTQIPARLKKEIQPFRSNREICQPKLSPSKKLTPICLLLSICHL